MSETIKLSGFDKKQEELRELRHFADLVNNYVIGYAKYIVLLQKDEITFEVRVHWRDSHNRMIYDKSYVSYNIGTLRDRIVLDIEDGYEHQLKDLSELMFYVKKESGINFPI